MTAGRYRNGKVPKVARRWLLLMLCKAPITNFSDFKVEATGHRGHKQRQSSDRQTHRLLRCKHSHEELRVDRNPQRLWTRS